MRKIFSAIALVMALAPLAANASDLPFKLIDNRVFVATTINGKGPYQFILDTGAPGFFISTDVMKALQTKPSRSEQSGGAGEGTETFYQLKLASVALGGATWLNPDAAAFSLHALNDVIGFRQNDGVIGKPLFDRYVVDIDFQSSTIHLRDPKTFAVPKEALIVPMDIYQGFLPVVNGSIAGIAGRFAVDVGDRSSLTLFGPFWKAHALDKRYSAGVDALTGYGVGGPVHSLVIRAPRLTFGPATVDGAVARISRQKTGAFADPKLAGSIGTGVLKHFRTIIDYPHKRFVLIPRDTAADRYDRAGLWLGLHGKQFAVLDVTSRSPAMEAGLKTGDVVTAVNGVSTETLDVFAVRETLRDPATADVTLGYLRGGKAGTARLRLRDLLPHT